MRADIYIAIDSMAPKATPKKYGYILECMINNAPVTKEGFGAINASYNSATIEAIAEALERFKKPCEVTIHSENTFVINMLVGALPKWAKNDFKLSSGKDVANKSQWQRVWKASENLSLLVNTEKHEYSEWLKNQMKGMKK